MEVHRLQDCYPTNMLTFTSFDLYILIPKSMSMYNIIVRFSSFVINFRLLSFKSAGAYWIDHIWWFVVSYLITNESFYIMMMMQEDDEFLIGLN